SYILRYDGVQWVRAYTDTWELDRLYINSQTDGWGISFVSRVIAHYDGTQFTQVSNPATSYPLSISMVSQYDGWIVGGAGTMLHYVDTTPTSTPTTTASTTSTPTATPSTMPFTDVHDNDYFDHALCHFYRRVITPYCGDTT